METQSIVVLDFGAQYSQLIARRIRELSVFSAVLPCNASLDEIRSYSPVGIILSGGPSSVYDKDAPVADPGVFELGLPVWTYEHDGNVIEKRLVMPHRQNTVFVTYERKSGSGPMQLMLGPWINFRPHEGSLSSPILPPIMSTRRAEIDRPSPVPP